MNIADSNAGIEELDDFEAPVDHWLVKKIVGSILIIIFG